MVKAMCEEQHTDRTTAKDMMQMLGQSETIDQLATGKQRELALSCLVEGE